MKRNISRLCLLSCLIASAVYAQESASRTNVTPPRSEPQLGKSLDAEFAELEQRTEQANKALELSSRQDWMARNRRQVEAIELEAKRIKDKLQWIKSQAPTTRTMQSLIDEIEPVTELKVRYLEALHKIDHLENSEDSVKGILKDWYRAVAEEENNLNRMRELEKDREEMSRYAEAVQSDMRQKLDDALQEIDRLRQQQDRQQDALARIRHLSLETGVLQLRASRNAVVRKQAAEQISAWVNDFPEMFGKAGRKKLAEDLAPYREEAVIGPTIQGIINALAIPQSGEAAIPPDSPEEHPGVDPFGPQSAKDMPESDETKIDEALQESKTDRNPFLP